MKILFAGTPVFAVLPLQKLIKTGAVAAVLTNPDKPQGRKGILTPPPVKVAAEAAGVEVLQFEDLSQNLDRIRAIGAELMVTCAYGKILRQELLDSFQMGVFNIHASLLPRYRGAAPIARAIMDGERETGITIMKTELGLDAGDMLMQRKLAIEDSDTCGSLTQKLSFLAGEMIVGAVEEIAEGNYTLKKQGEGSLCKKVQRTKVDFSAPARVVSRLIRGLSPAPLAFGVTEGLSLNFYMAEELPCDAGEPYEVVAASPKEGLLIRCGEGAVRISTLQPAGGKVMPARDFLNGRKIQKGQRFEPVL